MPINFSMAQIQNVQIKKILMPITAAYKILRNAVPPSGPDVPKGFFEMYLYFDAPLPAKAILPLIPRNSYSTNVDPAQIQAAMTSAEHYALTVHGTPPIMRSANEYNPMLIAMAQVEHERELYCNARFDLMQRKKQFSQYIPKDTVLMTYRRPMMWRLLRCCLRLDLQTPMMVTYRFSNILPSVFKQEMLMSRRTRVVVGLFNNAQAPETQYRNSQLFVSNHWLRTRCSK